MFVKIKESEQKHSESLKVVVEYTRNGVWATGCAGNRGVTENGEIKIRRGPIPLLEPVNTEGFTVKVRWAPGRTKSKQEEGH
jgi:hypothetical protein